MEGTLRILLVFILASTLLSCSKVRNFEQATTTKSKIDSLFDAKNINEKFGGDSVKIKLIIPLSKNTMGHYNIKDVLSPTCDKEDENYENCLVALEKYYAKANMKDEDKSFFQRFAEGAKFDLYNFFIKMGVSSKLKYSFDYSLEGIPTEFFTNVKVSKIFFALEECEKENEDCLKRQEDKPLTFDFIDKFFLNVSTIQDHDSLDFIEKPLAKLSKKKFNKHADRAFGQQVKEIKEVKDLDGDVSDNLFYNINIARLDNSTKKRKKRRRRGTLLGEENVRDNGKTFIFNLEEGNVREAKRFFKGEAFAGIVRDVTLIGTSLYVDLEGAILKDKFFEVINHEVEDIHSLGITDFKGCNVNSCTNLTVNSVNLLPLIKKSDRLKFDTFVSIKHLDYNDFKYSGYIELSVEMDLPY